MELKNIKSVYFVGAGGIGMSAIARYFIHRGLVVAGYDKTPSALTAQLEKEGMLIHYEENVDDIPHACKRLTQHLLSILLQYQLPTKNLSTSVRMVLMLRREHRFLECSPALIKVCAWLARMERPLHQQCVHISCTKVPLIVTPSLEESPKTTGLIIFLVRKATLL